MSVTGYTYKGRVVKEEGGWQARMIWRSHWEWVREPWNPRNCSHLRSRGSKFSYKFSRIKNLIADILFIFYLFLVTDKAYGSSWARDWILAAFVTYATVGSFNPLHWARGWTIAVSSWPTAPWWELLITGVLSFLLLLYQITMIFAPKNHTHLTRPPRAIKK